MTAIKLKACTGESCPGYCNKGIKEFLDSDEFKLFYKNYSLACELFRLENIQRYDTWFSSSPMHEWLYMYCAVRTVSDPGPEDFVDLKNESNTYLFSVIESKFSTLRLSSIRVYTTMCTGSVHYTLPKTSRSPGPVSKDPKVINLYRYLYTDSPPSKTAPRESEIVNMAEDVGFDVSEPLFKDYLTGRILTKYSQDRNFSTQIAAVAV